LAVDVNEVGKVCLTDALRYINAFYSLTLKVKVKAE